MLERIRSEGRAAFIPFVVAGYPSFEVTEKMVDALVMEGADLLELGVPFSDALADGPIIQAASEQASAQVDSIGQVLEFAARISAKHSRLPLILFTYFNPILKFGLEKFAQAARASGVYGVLVVDLPPEEAGPYRAALEKHQLKTIFLVSPTTSSERIRIVAEASTGFIYSVSRTGVTGTQTELSRTLSEEMERLRALTSKPIAVGFGISNGEQARQVAAMGDAVVVGSAFVKLVSQYAETEKLIAAVRALAREIAAAVRAGHS